VSNRSKVPRPGLRARSAWLLEHAEAAFGFLVSERGFSGPEIHDHGLTYHSPIGAIEILYDEHVQDVETLACGPVGDVYVRACVSCLLVEAGLGPAQHVKTVARTTHGLKVALASQADAVRRLLVKLEADDRTELLSACYAH